MVFIKRSMPILRMLFKANPMIKRQGIEKVRDIPYATHQNVLSCTFIIDNMHVPG